MFNIKRYLPSFSNPLDIRKSVNKFKKRKRRFTIKTAGKILLYSLLTFIFGIALLFAWFSKDLPTPGKIKHRYPSQSSKIFARDGKTQLYALSGEFRREIIPASSIPQNLRNATVAIEDKDFYRHHGIDFGGIMRAAYYDIARKDLSQGGSTLTQQFVKNALLSPKKTFTRKIKEMILSIEIEFMYNKEDILTMYLNEIPYGSNAYGVEAAAKTYFNKHAKNLNLSESATIAALTQAPTYYYNHQADLKARRNTVLTRMAQQGYISQDDANKAKTTKIKFSRRRENILSPHFVMYVKEVLVAKYGEKMVEEGGLQVITTLDVRKQKIAEKVVRNNTARLKGYNASNAGLVAIDPKTGQILSMIGSLDYFDQENDGNFNVTLAERQPGSSIKPLVYATAFEGKYNPAYVLFDLKTNFGNYKPNNYDYRTRGPVTIRQAIGNSLNIPAVKMLALVSIDKFIDTAHAMGITTLQDRSRYGLSIAIGAGEVKPLDMATAYGVFANQGKLAPTTPILSVRDANGKALEEWKPNQNVKQVLKTETAYEMSNILSDLDAKRPTFNGSLDVLSLNDRPSAVKTGTTNSWRDAWTVGYTPSLATAVWVGNNDNTPLTNVGGAIGAAPLWHDYMSLALRGSKVEEFKRPDSIKEIWVDKFSNKLPSKYTPRNTKIKDIFAPWQEPTEQDNIHVIVKVCRSNGLLAPDDAPDYFVTEKLFTNLHSEFPDKSNWENPVRYWARSRGMNNLPPTKYCKIGDIKPQVSITSPSDGANISGNFTIRASASFVLGIKQVEFLIDNISVGTDTSSPYSILYNANSLSNGEHTISARATSTNDVSTKEEITIKVGNDSTPPGNVSNIDAISSSPGTVRIQWVNPTDSDLSKVRIYMSSSNLSVGTLKGEFSANPGVVQEITFTGLTAGTKCFTIRSVDVSGNEQQVLNPRVCL